MRLNDFHVGDRVRFISNIDYLAYEACVNYINIKDSLVHADVTDKLYLKKYGFDRTSIPISRAPNSLEFVFQPLEDLDYITYVE